MNRWGVGANSACVLCLQPLETRDHFFFSCVYSSGIWTALTKTLFGANYSIDWQTMVTYISDNNLNRTQSFIARYVFQASIHTIWKERNARRHGESPTPQSQLLKIIDKQVRNQLLSIKLREDKRYYDGLQIWVGVTTQIVN